MNPVGDQENDGHRERRDHRFLVLIALPRTDQEVAAQQQDRSGAVEDGVDGWETVNVHQDGCLSRVFASAIRR